MPAAASNPAKQTYQRAAQFVVWLSDQATIVPTEDDEIRELFPVSVRKTANGHRDDVITLEQFEPEALEDFNLLSTYCNRQVEIRLLDNKGKPTEVAGWGVIGRQPMRVDANQQQYSLEARIGDEHFGLKLVSYPVWFSLGAGEGERVDVDLDLIFNPEIDGLICPNMSDKTDPGDEAHSIPSREWHFVLHPESSRTTTAEQYQEQTPESWKLSDAVLLLCWLLNPDEDFIKNPTQVDVSAAFKARDELLKNVRIPPGTSLPDALDILLAPYEYGWHLVHSTVDVDGLEFGKRETHLRFFQRGIGWKKSLLLQRNGSTRDIKQTNVASFDAGVDLAQVANRIVCLGDFEKREVTVRLSMLWDQQYDNTRMVDLREGTEFSKAHPEVGRKYGLDLAGDYVGLRDELTEAFNLNGLFTKSPIQRRRRFLRCLSTHPDGDDRESNGYRVEWWNEHVAEAVDPDVKTDPGWQKVKWPFSVLEKEAGILFDGDAPPPQLWANVTAGHPEKVHVRITATLAGDHRVTGDATRAVTSKNPLDMTIVLDVSDKFQNGKIDTSDEFGSIFSTDPTDVRDDTDAIQEYAEAVQSAEDFVRLDTSVPLEGLLHPEFNIGDVITNISPRNIDLGLGDSRYPQVVGTVLDFQAQRCELLLETFRKERPQVTFVRGKRAIMGRLPAQRGD